ncbi:MAG: LCP family protein, partial [Clostridiales bacterium]|nr:LCP family protein [Clostridiales bacterium]
ITEKVEAPGVGSVHLTRAGANHLDGVQAVAYARLRLMDTDFNRTERQRKVLGLAMEKAKSADVSTLIALVNTVYPQISTSIGLDEVLSLAKNAKKYYISQTSGFPFSHQEMKIDGKSCVIPTTLESNVIQLHSFLYDKTDYTPSDTVLDASNHIAEVTGLGEPGKDTESGKNVGTEGNTGSTSGSSQGNTAQTAAESAAVTETESIEHEEETESAEETETIEETIEALTGEETENVGENVTGQEKETEDEKHAITQGQTGEEATNAEHGPSGPGTTPTTAASREEPVESAPHNALEAPGENSGTGTSGAEGGPGVTGPGN